MLYKILDCNDRSTLGFLDTEAEIETIEEVIKFIKQYEDCNTVDIADTLERMGHEAYLLELETLYL